MTEDTKPEAEDTLPADVPADGPLAPIKTDAETATSGAAVAEAEPPAPTKGKSTGKRKGTKAAAKPAAEAPAATPPKKGMVQLQYVGGADSFRHGDHVFRRGDAPQWVPTATAEELQTYPHERFVVVEE